MFELQADQRLGLNNWHVISRANNGTVSLLKNMSLDAAVKSAEWLKSQGTRNGMTYYDGKSGHIEDVHILGPDGWDGCTKAWNHIFVYGPPQLCAGGPNEGRHHESGACSHCNQYSFRWTDGLPDKR